MESAFAKFLSDHAGQVNEFMAACYRGKTDNADIDRYLYEPLAEFSEHGGKRHRPLICMLAALAVGGSPERALRSAAADWKCSITTTSPTTGSSVAASLACT